MINNLKILKQLLKVEEEKEDKWQITEHYKSQLKTKIKLIQNERDRCLKLIKEFKGEEYTDLEVWKGIRKELKSRING